MINLEPFWVTAKLATITTIVLFVVAVPLSYWLSYSKWKLKALPEVLISLPLVLPPSVLGFYLLLAFSPENAFGAWIEQHLGLRLVFSFPGLVIASVIYSMPFMVNPLVAGFRSLPDSLKEASYTLGKSTSTTLFKVLLPNIRPAIITGLVMTFVHTVGEFGVVLMVGGSIPNETKVVSISIYEDVQAMNYKDANIYAGILFLFTVVILLLVHIINNKHKRSTLF